MFRPFSSAVPEARSIFVFASTLSLAVVSPHLDSKVILRWQGHLANARAPGKVARIIEMFADRVMR